MTKILIISDSHGWTEELETVKQRHKDEVDYMIHCGDSELPNTSPEISGFVTVRGNCDHKDQFPEEASVTACGRKLFVTHGHLYSVKSTLMNLYYRAKEVQADIVCFGHSHLLGMECIDDILFLNPGSIRMPRGRKDQTYIILELKQDGAEVFVYELNKGELPELRHQFPLSKRN